MFYEIFRFELRYRLRRPETYFFFLFLLAFSIFGVDFIFQGVELGMVKNNSPILVGKAMGAITGIFMIMASLIMGIPMIRDDRYQITDLFYTKPIRQYDLLLGRFLGSFLILIIIFSGIPLGMMMGEFLPWRLPNEMNSFHFPTYANGFMTIVFPTLFFGAALFFVTGSLSRNLLVVYTQGIVLFVIFLLTKAITNEYLQAILDPFSLTTLTQYAKDWTVAERNSMQLSVTGVLWVNKVFWMGLGILILWFGLLRFKLSSVHKSRKSSKHREVIGLSNKKVDVQLPYVTAEYGIRSQILQFIKLSIFYTKSLLKETSFWAIAICGIIVIIVNSINLGTVHGVDSYPTTYFIIEELQEMSLYFFIIILLFYSGELFWKEHSVGINLMTDATPMSSLINISSKTLGLISVYFVLMISLILCGIIFQMAKGYYHFDFSVYFTGFFIEILPFLVVYTIAAFSIQSLVNNKFIGILITLVFFIVTIALGLLGMDHVLFNFGGSPLMSYSEMNGYGHFLAQYLWTKAYWILFSILFLILAAYFSARGIDVNFVQRLKKAKSNVTKQSKILILTIFILCGLLGTYLTYQTNVLNEVWSEKDQQNYRANYEKTLKQYEYFPQAKITSSKLFIELYPELRSYELKGKYVLKNQSNYPISEVHIQKIIQSEVTIDSIVFSRPISVDSQYQEFEYLIYKLERPLAEGDSLIVSFKQSLKPRGFSNDNSGSQVLNNGTFIRNIEFPTLGYNRKYELSDESERKQNGLEPRPAKADLDDANERIVARTGDDSHGLRTYITIGTNASQTAVTSGKLNRKWAVSNRNYFQYESSQPIINFYSILSGKYDVKKDSWFSENQKNQDSVELEIYYHPRHTYNLDRMMNGMKASLDYYSSNFSPYQYGQLRIVEFPRYAAFAQSFPNTIPFSESIGFMLDIDDRKDIDMTFFVTAHEVAHQWWGMQLETANVKGRNLVLETLSQYSALMVFKKQFSQAKVDQFLALQQELYKKGQKRTKVEEVALYLVEKEEYIYYNKGAIVMYKLQEVIGEETLNKALSLFLRDWNSHDGELKLETERYATSEDLICYFIEAAPNEKRSEVMMLFKEK